MDAYIRKRSVYVQLIPKNHKLMPQTAPIRFTDFTEGGCTKARYKVNMNYFKKQF